MGYDEDLCSMSCNGSSIKYISSGRGFGIGMETGWNGTRQCVMGSWSEDTCIAPEEELGSGDSAVHIPRDVHEEGMHCLSLPLSLSPLVLTVPSVLTVP